MKAAKVISWVFLLIGLGLLAGGGFAAWRTSDFVSDALQAPGEVIELVRSRSSDSVTYAPVVRFTTAEGEAIEFRHPVSSSPPSYRTGERVTVLYRQGDPHRARIRGFFSLWGLPLIFGGMGTVFALTGGALPVFDLLSRRRREHLRRHGVGIDTDLQGVERNTSLKVNGRSPFVIVSQWQNPATGEIHVFRSENLWFDPSAHIGTRKIRVLIERTNPRRYYVDLSFLPKAAG